MTEQRGFQHDRLTEADDNTVDAVRTRLHACPCGALQAAFAA